MASASTLPAPDQVTVPRLDRDPIPAASLDHEQLLVRRGRRSGVYTVIAVHSTRLGPALGGCRLHAYPHLSAAVADALRLSSAMTLKAAAAGLDLGGGKGVICLPPAEPAPTGMRRREILLDFADAVAALDGAYVTAEDVGTSADDMVVVAERTPHVTGLPRSRGGSGDPSPVTAEGVEAALRASSHEVFGSRDLAGRSVAIVGTGHVGSALARRLAAAGAELVLADVDPAAPRALSDLPGARWATPEQALVAEVDVLAPCALGGIIDDRSAAGLRCPIVCGAANNQLAEERLADELAGRGILYAPDFVVNAGGLINISLERGGAYDPGRAHAAVGAIESLLERIFRMAEFAGITPLAAARRIADQRLSAAAPPRARSSPSAPA